MSDPVETYKLEIVPIPPQTIDSIRQEIIPFIEEALRESGHGDLLNKREIEVSFDETFPTSDQLLLLGLQAATSIGVQVIAKYVFPKIDEWYAVRKRVTRKKPKKRRRTK